MKLPVLPPRKVLRALQRAGFYIHHQTGSHAILYDVSHRRRVTVPIHARDVKKKTLDIILEQAQLPVEELRKFL